MIDLMNVDVREIPLTRGLFATVSGSDYAALMIWKWQAQWNPGTRSYYAKRRGGFQMHRDILGLVKGDRRKVDHINHNTLDNTRDNLRSCTQAENLRNMRRMSTNKSGVTGVSWREDRQYWLAKIYINNQQIELGKFPKDKKEEAIAVRKAAEVHYFGEFAYQELA